MRAALTAGIIAGLVVALAPAIPTALRSPSLVLALTIWCLGAGWVAVAGLRALARTGPSWPAAIGLLGIALAALAATELEMIRQLGDRPALTWNVDWRYALSHAQAIARTGSVDSALDYAGAPINYHVGPAWFAGAVARSFGGGISFALFGIIPLLSVITFASASVFLLRGLGVNVSVALAATGLVMSLPGLAATAPRTAYCLVLSSCRSSPVLWTFSHELMLNSYQGMALGFSAIALLVHPESRVGRSALAAAGIAALIMIKPQFAVAFGAVAALVGFAWIMRVGGVPSRGVGVLAAAAGSMVIALIMMRTLPHVEGRIATPEFAPGRTGFTFNEDRHVATLLLVAALLTARRFFAEHRGVRALMLATAATLLVLATLWAVVSFPLPAALVDRATMVGLTDQGRDATQRDLAQSLQPLRVLIGLLALAALVAAALTLKGRRAVAAHTVGALMALSPIMFVGAALIAPRQAYEAAEDIELLRVLERIPTDAGLLISSDLADAAENFRRPLRGIGLTAHGGHAFYVANLKYWHYAWPDSHERITALRTFFGSPWSEWHSRWLAKTGIGGVLVHTRCTPPWLNDRTIPLRVVAREGAWIAFAPTGLDRGTAMAPPAWQHISPAYGQSECLTGARRTDERNARSAS